jgi:hypothetical protein
MSTEMIAITTNSSTRVNPRLCDDRWLADDRLGNAA